MWDVYQDVISATKKYKNVTTVTKEANDEQELQYSQISQLIADDVDVIVTRLVADKEKGHPFYKKVLEKIKQENIPAVIYANNINKLHFRDYKNVYFVGAIQAKLGMVQADVIAKDWKANPDWDLNKDGVIQYVILKGVEGNEAAEARTKWVSAMLKGHKSEQVALEVANWSPVKAEEIVNNWLDSGFKDKIEVYVANGDDMALGVVKALKDNGLQRPVFGGDGLQSAVKAVQSGDLKATVSQGSTEQAEESVNLAVNLARGNPLDTNTKLKVFDRKISIPHQLVEKSNAKDFSTK